MTRSISGSVDRILSDEVQQEIRKQRADLNEVMYELGTTEQGRTTNLIDQYIDPRQYMGANAYGVEGDDPELHKPASFGGTDVQAPAPTSSIDRPRTVAAAYEKDRQVLTIVFGTGVIYNYYQVTEDEWDTYYGLPSKWQYIRDFLDSKPRGYANTTDLPPALRMYSYRATRASQIARQIKPR
jgi:hypothetical protein